jgi:hypothetical protein
MKIVVAGGGFLGRPLCETCAEDGHEVVVLTRGLPPGEAAHEAGTGVPGVTRLGWVPDGQVGPWAGALEGADAVVNLAGESIGGRRWTAARKRALRDSRVLATRSLVSAILALPHPPAVLVSASGVNYYGCTDQSPKAENAAPAADFLAALCVEWEEEAARARRPGTRVVLLRTGLALERSGGVLPQLALPFRFFVGATIASTRQTVSWIHRRDWVELVRWAIKTPDLDGPLNATAPVPVTNRAFSRALAHALHRPCWLWAPALPLRLALGEMADTLVIGGQHVVPTRALELGFYFRYPEIDQAFRAIYQT